VLAAAFLYWDELPAQTDLGHQLTTANIKQCQLLGSDSQEDVVAYFNETATRLHILCSFQMQPNPRG